MPRIEDINQRVGAAGPVDYAAVQPDQTFSDFGRQAAGAAAVLTEIADHDAALEGASALADFRAARAKRQTELRTQAKDLQGFTDLALADFDESADQLVTAHDNPRVQAFLGQRLNELRSNEEIESDGWAAATMVQRTELKTVEVMSKLSNVLANNPGQYAAVMADYEAAIAAAGLPAVNAERALITGRAKLSDAAIDGLIFKAPYEAKKQLGAGAWNDRGIDVAAKLNRADAEIKQREAEARAKQVAASAAVVAGLSVKINQLGNGQGDDVRQEDIDAIKGSLTPSAWADLQRQFDDARARRAAAEGDRAEVATILQMGGSIDPGNTKQVKALDGFFRNSVLPEIEAQTATIPEAQRGAAQTARVLAFVKQQGVVPETLRAGVRTALRSGTPEQKAQAAQTVEQIKAVSPRALLDLDDETLRQANLISSYVDAGATAADATRKAEEVLRQSDGVSKDLGQQYDVAAKESPVGPWLSQKMGTIWSWSYPTVPGVVESEVRALERSEFQRNGGNLEAARRTALDMVSKRFGVTNINGEKTVTRNPVEQHYALPWLSPSQTAAAVKAEAVEDIRSGGATDGVLTSDRVRVLPYPAKGVVAADGRPAYAIEVQDSAGNWTVQMDEDPKSLTFGLPKPWAPSLAKEKAKRDAAVKEAIEQAKALRDGTGTAPNPAFQGL